MEKDVEYEKFTQEIYQSLINAQGLNTVTVKHNVLIEGRSGQKHQIDGYWEYELAGVLHRVAIECKNYNTAISKGKVSDFYGVLSDIGNIIGIMVTKVGYQKGAKVFAEHYGINLKEIRKPEDADWKGRLRKIVVNLNLVVPKVTSRYIQVDEEWVKNNIQLPNEILTYSVKGMADEIWIVDGNGNQLKNFYELEEELPHAWEAKKNLQYSYPFNDGFINVESFGRVKIIAIHYTYEVRTSTNKVVIDGKDSAKAILKDSISGEVKFFNNDGKIK